MALLMGAALYVTDVGTRPGNAAEAGAPGAEHVRDPFWPVGYRPASEAPQEEPETSVLDLSRLSPEEQAIIKSHLKVGGILQQGNERIAIINTDVVKEGDTVALRVSGQTYRFLIRSLEPRNIVLEPIKTESKPQAEK
jgi:hypothetical protein